jgi:transposase
MNLHRNAKLSVKGRELLVDRVENAGWSLTKAAEAAGVSDRTASKWVAQYRAEGLEGLLDRSSAPSVVANRTDEGRVRSSLRSDGCAVHIAIDDATRLAYVEVLADERRSPPSDSYAARSSTTAHTRSLWNA